MNKSPWGIGVGRLPSAGAEPTTVRRLCAIIERLENPSGCTVGWLNLAWFFKENTPPALDGIDFEATIFIAKASKDPDTMPAKP
jgi:hypothetical protein